MINKRIGMLNLEYLMEKGTSIFYHKVDLYKAHLKEIAS